MNQDRKEKESVFKQSFDEVKAYFKGFRFDKPHLKAALPFFLEMLFFVFIITLDLTLKDYLYKFVVGEHGGNFTVIDGFSTSPIPRIPVWDSAWGKTALSESPLSRSS